MTKQELAHQILIVKGLDLGRVMNSSKKVLVMTKKAATDILMLHFACPVCQCSLYPDTEWFNAAINSSNSLDEFNELGKSKPHKCEIIGEYNESGGTGPYSMIQVERNGMVTGWGVWFTDSKEDKHLKKEFQTEKDARAYCYLKNRSVSYHIQNKGSLIHKRKLQRLRSLRKKANGVWDNLVRLALEWRAAYAAASMARGFNVYEFPDWSHPLISGSISQLKGNLKDVANG